jgi:TRAP-type mannitol/chloroaromatic compound transport system substrate-binding protein
MINFLLKILKEAVHMLEAMKMVNVNDDKRSQLEELKQEYVSPLGTSCQVGLWSGSEGIGWSSSSKFYSALEKGTIDGCEWTGKGETD